MDGEITNAQDAQAGAPSLRLPPSDRHTADPQTQEEQMSTSRRAAGLGLLAYGIGTPLVVMTIGSPGGDYDDTTVASYVSGGYTKTFLLAYVGMFAALGLLAFGARMREELGAAGRPVFGLAVAGSAAAVIGWLITGGVAVAAAEGGGSVASIPHPVIYALTEIGNLVSWCGSGFFVGALALVLAVRAQLPTALRALTVIAGVCGIVAPLFFPIFLFWLWAIGFGIYLTATSTRRPEPMIEVQPA
jgi:predicted small lipoprotein YifL